MERIVANITLEQNIQDQSFYATLLQHTQDAVFVRELDGKIIYWNRAAERLYGYANNEAQGRNTEELLQVVYPGDVYPFANRDEPREEWEGELIHRTKEGRVLTVHSRQTLIRVQGKKLIVEANRDLTQQKQFKQEQSALRESEKLLSASEARLALTLESISDALVTVDRDWRYTFINAEAELLLGLPRAELLGKKVWELFPAIMGTEVERQLRRAVAEQITCEFEGYYPEWQRWYENKAYPTPDGGVSVYFRDVTERKGTEEALRESEERFRLLVQHSAHIIWRTDPDGNFIGRQESWERFTGQHFEDYQAFGGFNAIHPEDRDAVARYWQKAIANSAAFQAEYRLRDRNGEYRYVLARGIPMLDATGRVKEWVGYIEDITERKRTEERYRGLFTSMQEGLLLAELIADNPIDFRYLDVNPAAEQLLGMRREQIVGKTARAIISDVREDLLQMYAEVVRTGESLRHEVFEPMLNQYHENFVFRPAPGQVAVLFWDITERKRSEEALRESERRLRFITDNAPVLIAYCGADRTYKFMNKPNAARFGLHPRDVVGKHFAEVMGQEAYARIKPYVDTVLRGEKVEYEMEVPYEGIGTRYMWVAYEPEFDEAGQVTGYVAAIHDITERRQIEEALRASEAREHARAEELATLMETVPAVVFIAHNPEATIITGSRTAREVLKMQPRANLSRTAPEQERPTHFKVFKDGVEVPSEELPIQLAARGNEVRDYEEEVRFDDGTSISLLGNAVPLLDQEGKPRGSIGAFVDITAHKRLEAALREADRRKDEFLAMLAHELRNPLAPIRNAVQVMRHSELPATQFEQMRDVIERQTEHLARLVDDLLDVSRITQGRITLRKESVELLNIIGRAIETSRPLIDARKHLLTVVLPSEPVRLEGDFIRLAQVVSNLLNNAAKYTDEGGDIRLTAKLQGNEVLLSVKDNGIGIPAEELPHIFDLFTQTERSLDRAQGGLGIGLTLVQRLVEMHGGRVEACSAGLGQGCEFTVHLPLSFQSSDEQTAAPAKLVESPAEAKPAACRILVVDDNIDSAGSLGLLLKLEGYEVEMAHDGPSTIDVALAFRPQVILLDIGLPGMSGYEVARRLRKEPGLEKVVLIALTGYGQVEDRLRSKEAGFDHHLTKPVDYDLLPSLIDSLILE